MDTVLCFESDQSYLVLRQEEVLKDAACITLQLALTDGPIIYASDFSVIGKTGWRMTIRRAHANVDAGAGASDPAIGSVRYAVAPLHPRCVIDVVQSPERFTALLDLFKAGHPSEIRIVVEGLTDRADYSKTWNTAQAAVMRVTSLGFEFPLPESEP